MIRTAEPAFHSLAFDDIPAPDHADVMIIPLPVGSTSNPRLWAETIFSPNSMPGWILALLGFRQAIVGIIGIPQAPSDVFKVSKVEGEEALITADEAHLDFRCGVGVDSDAKLLRVTTTVRFNGWRGRLYFAFVQPLHPLILGAMMRKSVRVLSPKTQSGRSRANRLIRRTS